MGQPILLYYFQKITMKTIIKGFRFGLLLQLAIGPVCLFIIKTAAESGVLTAEAGVMAVMIRRAWF